MAGYGDIAPIENLPLSSEKPDFSKSVPLTEPTLGREWDDRERRYVGKLQTKTFPFSSTPSFLLHKPGKSKPSLEYIGLEPHLSLRHGAPTSLLREICSRNSLNGCDAWVTAAPAHITAATMAASVSIVSFAPGDKSQSDDHSAPPYLAND